MSARNFFGSPPNRRRFWRRPVLAKLGLSDEAARSTAARRPPDPAGSDQASMSDPTIRLTVSLAARRATGRYETYRFPWARKPNRATRRRRERSFNVISNPDTSYRFACLLGMCRSLRMTVNGARWTCRTHVLELVKDGAVSRSGSREFLAHQSRIGRRHQPFLRQWQRPKRRGSCPPYGHDGSNASCRQRPRASPADAAIECINLPPPPGYATAPSIPFGLEFRLSRAGGAQSRVDGS